VLSHLTQSKHVRKKTVNNFFTSLNFYHELPLCPATAIAYACKSPAAYAVDRQTFLDDPVFDRAMQTAEKYANCANKKSPLSGLGFNH
jgi:hypothetical protein